MSRQGEALGDGKDGLSDDDVPTARLGRMLEAPKPGNAGAQGTPLTTAARPARREGSRAQNNSPESACSSSGGKPKRHFSPKCHGLKCHPLMGPKWTPNEPLSPETIRYDRC